MKERVLITGASGFVGYHLIDAALKNDLEVTIAIRKSSKVSHLQHFDIDYVYPDFEDAKSFEKILREKSYQYIIHAAGATTARSQEEYNHINADYTYTLASAAMSSEIPLKKFVLISSLAGIGPLTTADGVITEETPPHPITAYGRSKLLAEDKLKEFATLNYTILRPTGVYGPRDKDIFIFFKQVARGIEPYIGRKAQKFSFLYVTDLAQATIKALNNGNRGIYNLSDGRFYDRYQLAAFIKKSLNRKAIKLHLPVKFVKIIAKVSEKYSAFNNKAATLNAEKVDELMAANWHCSINKAKHDLGFTPLYDLAAGVAETIDWYKTNKWL